MTSNNFVIMMTFNDTVKNFNTKIAGSILEYELENEVIDSYIEDQKNSMERITKIRSI